MEAEIYRKKTLILNELLKIIPFEGCNDHALAIALDNAKLPREYADLLFPAGIKDLFDFYADETIAKMIMKVNELILPNMKVRDKILRSIQILFAINLEHKQALKRMVAYFLIPTHIKQGVKLTWRAADKIWYNIGDKSIDYNFYTKRLILAKIISASFIFWLNDESDNYENTEKFIAKKIAATSKIGELKKVVKKIPFVRLLFR